MCPRPSPVHVRVHVKSGGGNERVRARAESSRMHLTPALHVNVDERGRRMHVGYRSGGEGCVCACVCATHPHLYPLEARLYPQLLHRPPSVADVVGAVSLRRHGGENQHCGTRKRKEWPLHQRLEQSLISSPGGDGSFV